MFENETIVMINGNIQCSYWKKNKNRGDHDTLEKKISVPYDY